MKKWEINYKGHSIIVQNSGSQERLFVDGNLQHENFGLGFRSSLYGTIKTEEKAGSEVKVILGGFWQVQCRIFVDQELIFHSKPDKDISEILKSIEN